jgi:hypothetical protein
MSQLRPRQVLLSSEELGESPVFPTIAILVAAALYATLPTRFVVGSSAGIYSAARWVVPALTAILLVVLLLSVPHGRVARLFDVSTHRLRVGRRFIVLTVTAIISAANGASIVWLVHLLVNGAQTHASQLLRAGIHMWCLNVLVFALWFWELDSGGPRARLNAKPADRDFVFPQQAQPDPDWASWRPVFLDYLYLVHERHSVQPDGRHALQPVGENADARRVRGKLAPRDHGRRASGEHPQITR